MSLQRPSNVPEYAEHCLHALSEAGLSHLISLGGAFGLLHYLDYRSTNDVDAWWCSVAAGDQRRQVIDVLVTTLGRFGDVRIRTWGDVSSVELYADQGRVFSFQIASRSVQLEPSVPLPWIDALLDSLEDLVASKMVALIERGAPRDFRDIYAVCTQGLVTPQECWALWRQRQGEADASPDRARLALQIHLERIRLHRPLETISDLIDRGQAQAVRDWYAEEFLDALVD